MTTPTARRLFAPVTAAQGSAEAEPKVRQHIAQLMIRSRFTDRVHDATAGMLPMSYRKPDSSSAGR